jgi:hypothetical protein
MRAGDDAGTLRQADGNWERSIPDVADLVLRVFGGALQIATALLQKLRQ